MPPKLTHTLTVHVSGTVDIPLNASMLEDLQDTELAKDILRECARLGVAEKLGYFDAMTITTSDVPLAASSPPSSSPLSDGVSHRTSSPQRLVCHAELDLEKLGHCLTAIQDAYNRMLEHAVALKELLAAADVDGEESGKANSEAKETEETLRPPAALCGSASCERKLSAMSAVLDAMLHGTASVVEAAAQQQQEQREEPTAAKEMLNGEGGRDQPDGEETATKEEEDDGLWEDYRCEDPEAAGYRPLLQEEDSGEDDSNSDDVDGAVDARDYAARGYTAL